MASPVWRTVGCQLHKLSLISRTAKPLQTPGNGLMKGCLMEIAKRNGGDGARTMRIQPSRFGWTSFRNDLHFYAALGLIPLGSIVLYSNLFIGQSELAEIPEGYDPKPWEYYKHPIHRWFMKYFYDDPIKYYEMAACKRVYEFEKTRYKARRAMVYDMMYYDTDYRGYYFQPAIDPTALERYKKQLADEEPLTKEKSS